MNMEKLLNGNQFMRKFVKTVLYAVLDQDATYRKYVSVKWPDIKIFYNSNQFWCFAYPWPRVVPEALQPYLRGHLWVKILSKIMGIIRKILFMGRWTKARRRRRS
jgi:hypothetical protein